MKLLTSIAATAILSGILAMILPWWSVALAAFIVAILSGLSPSRAFVSGALGVGFCWLIVALSRDIVNHQLLSSRMATLFHLSGSASFLAVTVFAGSLLGGLAALSASFFRARPTS